MHISAMLTIAITVGRTLAQNNLPALGTLLDSVLALQLIGAIQKTRTRLSANLVQQRISMARLEIPQPPVRTPTSNFRLIDNYLRVNVQ